jgi:hypothetical protein
MTVWTTIAHMRPGNFSNAMQALLDNNWARQTKMGTTPAFSEGNIYNRFPPKLRGISEYDFETGSNV